jgi:hypothetical protein
MVQVKVKDSNDCNEDTMTYSVVICWGGVATQSLPIPQTTTLFYDEQASKLLHPLLSGCLWRLDQNLCKQG